MHRSSRSRTERNTGPKDVRRALAAVAAAVFVAACGSSSGSSGSTTSSKPGTPSGGQSGAAIDAEFHSAMKAVIAATSFNFAITTRTGKQPVAHASGSFVGPDRSRMVSGDVERITAGDAAYFHGGAFGTQGWAKSDKGGSGDPDFMATVIVAQSASPVVRVGTTYTFDEAPSGGAPGRHWKVWLTSGRVSRVLYRSTAGVMWDETFSGYDSVPPIDPPAAAEVHELTATPPCPAGEQSNFAGFCRPV